MASPDDYLDHVMEHLDHHDASGFDQSGQMPQDLLDLPFCEDKFSDRRFAETCGDEASDASTAAHTPTGSDPFSALSHGKRLAVKRKLNF